MYDNDGEKRNFFKISEDVLTAALPSSILIRNSNCFEIEGYSFKNWNRAAKKPRQKFLEN